MPRPFSMNVTLPIRPERREEFLGAMREVLPRATGEEACVYLDLDAGAVEEFIATSAAIRRTVLERGAASPVLDDHRARTRTGERA